MTLGIGIGNNLLNNVFMIYLKLNCIAKKANRGLKPRRSFLQRIFKYVFRNLIANPDFEDKFEYVAQWYIEYDDVKDNVSCREIGLDSDGNIIVKMSDERNYGYWLDTNCELIDFEKMGAQRIEKEKFECLWDSNVG